MERLEFVVPERLDGARLDKALAELAQGVSRARIKKAIAEGEVRVDGKRRAKGALVTTGERLTVEAELANDRDVPATPTPEASLVVRHEAAEVLVVEKPAGQPTAPLRAAETGTLANALVGHFPELAGIGHGPHEPGIVHRLDTDTSGLVVVARTAPAFEALKRALKGDRLQKEYLLICASEGLADRGTIEFPLASHPKDQRRVYACVHPRDVARLSPREASTRYEVVSRHGDRALVRAFVSRALRHQIRVHFSAIEHPLVGDLLYGGEQVVGLTRHALHASRVAFDGDASVAAFDVRSELPEELCALLRAEE